jgi:hypothetical protein
MNIDFVEVQNFRKLKSARIDFAAHTTICVGANNSGKTSAMMALSLFLGKQGTNQRHFRCDDFTLMNWSEINKYGRAWEEASAVPDFKKCLEEWRSLLPTLDVWIKASLAEIHHVSHLLPTLSWNAEPIGVRLIPRIKTSGTVRLRFVEQSHHLPRQTRSPRIRDQRRGHNRLRL